MNIISNLFNKKKNTVFISGKERERIKETVNTVLGKYFNLKEFLVSTFDIKDMEGIDYHIRNSEKVAIIISDLNDVGEEEETKIFNYLKNLSEKISIVFDFDNEKIKKRRFFWRENAFTVGFNEGADFKASDIKTNGGTNFKINNKGKVVPVWLEKKAGKEEIFFSLFSTAVGSIFGLNLIEISQALKDLE